MISIAHILIAALGVVAGIVFGAIPGMTATMGVAVFLPMTYAYDLEMALYLLLGLYVGGISGGLVPAILINIPGTPSSITTTFDGYPMAKRGEGERALKIGILSSFVGGIISLICLWLFTPLLSAAALKFSAVEKFLIILFALTVIAALSKGQMLRGVFAGFLGVLTSLIGMFSVNNAYRMVPAMFKSKMQDGFQLLPVLIGLFAIAQIFEEAEEGMRFKIDKVDGEMNGNTKFSLKDFKGQGVNLVRYLHGRTSGRRRFRCLHPGIRAGKELLKTSGTAWYRCCRGSGSLRVFQQRSDRWCVNPAVKPWYSW